MSKKMIVLVEENSLTQNHIQQLHTLYPDDIVKYLKTDCFIEYLSEFVLNRLDPKRITLVGQASSQYFVDPAKHKFSPEELVSYLIDTCHLPKSVETIDLVGLSVDFITEGENFSREFAKQLAIRGYDHIEVKALTNLGNKDLGDIDFNIDVPTKKYEINGYKNTKENKKLAKEIQNAIEKLDKELAEVKHQIHKLVNQLNLLSTESKTLSSEKSQQKKDEYVTQIESLNEKLNQKLNMRNELNTRREALFNQSKVFTTHDVRKTLDKDVQFYFNGRIIKQIDHLMREIATKEKQSDSKSQYEIFQLEKNLNFVNKKTEFIVTLNAHIADIESSMRGFTLFSNVSSKFAKIKELQELKETLIQVTDLTTAINVIEDKLKTQTLLKGPNKTLTKDILQSMLNQMNELNEPKKEELEQRVQAG